MNDLIKEKIIELLGMECKVNGCKDVYDPCPHCEFSLADVLQAMEKNNVRLASYENGHYYVQSNVAELVATWNLITDYDGQTQETRTFIGKLLGVE